MSEDSDYASEHECEIDAKLERRIDELLSNFTDSYLGYVRCPLCRHHTRAGDLPDSAFEEGELELNCEACARDFRLEVSILYIWQSERIE